MVGSAWIERRVGRMRIEDEESSVRTITTTNTITTTRVTLLPLTLSNPRWRRS